MSSLPTTIQVSAGGVVYRKQEQRTEIALILVGPKARWQLPKGTVNTRESLEDAAQREVREETGLVTRLVCPIDRIEYWFFANVDGQRTRFHKFVHFFLMQYLSGTVDDHDHEVEEARWLEINQAMEMLAYESEKQMVRRAAVLINAEP